MIFQIIGLPGSGKSYAISNVLELNPGKYVHIDIRSFVGSSREQQMIDFILNHTHPNILAESACGIALPQSFIIELRQPRYKVYERLLARDGCFDEDYLSLLSKEIKHRDIILYNHSELFTILDIFT